MRALNHPALRMPLLGQVLRVWLEEYGERLANGTRTRAASYVRHELQYFARIAPTSLSDKCLWDYVLEQIKEGKKPGTICGGLIWLRRAVCLLYDCEYEGIKWVPPAGRKGLSPARRITKAMRDCKQKFSHLEEEVVTATPAECDLIMNVTREIAPEWAPFLQLALATGMRRSELRALMWDCVHLEGAALTIRRNFSIDKPSPPKSRRGIRVVALPPGAVELLRELKAQAIPGTDDYVFQHEGCFLKQAHVGNAMRDIFGEAEKRGLRPGLSLHALRRHYVSQGREHMSDAWLQNQVGHNAAMQKHYTDSKTVKTPDLSWADF